MTNYFKNIQHKGSGGGGKAGGGSGRAPIEAPDSLRSIQYAKIIDLVSEGEIGGLIDGMKSIYLSDTPIQNADGTYNFNNVVMEERVGLQSQVYMQGFDGAEAEAIVGTEVKEATSVTRSISNINATAVRVTLGFPQMTSQDTETGDLNGTSVTIAIDIQNNGGGFIPQVLRQIYSSAVFSLTPTAAVTIEDSTGFNITVAWAGEAIQSPQTCTFQLQYRAVGDVTWIVDQSYTFSGGAFSSGIFGSAATITTTAKGSKTFNLTLANDTYEFRVVKTTGSRQNIGFDGSTLSPVPSVGIAYGGTVSISAGEAYVPDETDVISGKCTSRYQRAYRLQLPAPGPWDIRVRRITVDSVLSILQNKTFFDSLTEIIEAKLTYANSAYVGIKIDAKQFNSIPTRGFEIYGMLVRVPTNYNSLTREYSGTWDGNFQIAWSDNPAWVFYDMVVSDRYGLGQFIEADQVDKWALYSIARYCDEMVQDGFGGIEPRFTCNLYLQTREQAYSLMANLASVFRGITWWSAGALTAANDAPADVSQLFSAANVVGGAFTYSGSSGKVRHTVALVGWNDPQDAYRQKIEYVEDVAGIARYGVVQTDVVATGCTSRGQAHRFGRAIIYSEQMETETVTFRAGMDSVYCSPGEIIQTSDPIRAGKRFGGRLLAASTTQVQLDAEFFMDASFNYSLSCVLPDGSVETVDVVNIDSTSDIVDCVTPFSIAPQAMSMWVIASEELNPESWRIVSMAEVDKTMLDITALAYRSDKYAFIEENLVLQPLPISLIEAGQPATPDELTFTESLYLSGLNVVSTKGVISWHTVPGAVSYILTYQRMEQNAVVVSGMLTNSLDIEPMQEGQYTISVMAVNMLGRRSQPAVLNVSVLGKRVPPEDITNFSITKSSGFALANWTAHPDLDVQVGGNIVVRHSPLTTGATWQDGVILDAFVGNAVSGLLPLITGTYMAKALDSSGNWSLSMVSFVATEGLVTGFTTVGSLTEDPTFTGTKTDTNVISSTLRLNGTLTGSYLFNSVLDLTTVATRRYEVDIAALSYELGNVISALGLVSTWGAFTGAEVDDCDATVYIATTNDDPGASPTWGPWTPFFVGDFTCRASKYMLNLVSGNINHNIAISTLRVHVKEPT